MRDLSVGDTVILKSGSMPMTIIAFDEHKEAILAYCTLDGVIMREGLPVSCLESTEEKFDPLAGDGEEYQ